jgi:hypothetical protein
MRGFKSRERANQETGVPHLPIWRLELTFPKGYNFLKEAIRVHIHGTFLLILMPRRHPKIWHAVMRHLYLSITYECLDNYTFRKKNSVAFSTQANYTDRATAACRRILCQLLRIEGVAWSAQRIPTAVNLGFLDRSNYFSIQVAPQLSSRGWVDPVPDQSHPGTLDL